MTASPKPPNERAFLLTLAGIQFCHIVDFMVMMPLGPFLMRELGINTREFGLLVAAYSFCAAISGLLVASVVDRFERKRFLLTVFGLFALATLLCGLAPGFASLLVARGLAGVFGGIMGAMVNTMLADAIPFSRRAAATGVIATAFSVSSVAGVPLSLMLADAIGWRAPFVMIAVMSVLLLLLGVPALPTLGGHLTNSAGARHPFASILAVLRDANQRRAMAFSATLIFSGFTVIPYLTVYAIGNVGIGSREVPVIYLAGGLATLFTARWIGRWADRVGKATGFRWRAVMAAVPILLATHLERTPLWAWLVVSTAFFVLVSGRMIPAMSIVSGAAEPRVRGAFMSLNSTLQSLAMAAASTLTGFIVSQEGSGRLVGYPWAGYLAVGLTLVLAWKVSAISNREPD
jgi:predicted MFS family arabinose efflux permease